MLGLLDQLLINKFCSSPPPPHSMLPSYKVFLRCRKFFFVVQTPISSLRYLMTIFTYFIRDLFYVGNIGYFVHVSSLKVFVMKVVFSYFVHVSNLAKFCNEKWFFLFLSP